LFIYYNVVHVALKVKTSIKTKNEIPTKIVNFNIDSKQQNTKLLKNNTEKSSK